MHQGGMPNFKTYYLHCTFKQLMEMLKINNPLGYFGKTTTLLKPQIISEYPGMK
jgi:hypothetical protein